MLNQKVNSLLSRFNLWGNPREVEPAIEFEGPVFIGTKKEFRRYIGPILRNLVQQISRKHRSEIGHCQHCNETQGLESAHVAGRNRNKIIDDLLREFASGELFHVNLKDFENKFGQEHEPLEKTILILCKSCHSKYDSGPTSKSVLSLTSSTPGYNGQVQEMKMNFWKKNIRQPMLTFEEFNTYKNCKIGAVVRETLPRLLKSERIAGSELLKLQDAHYSKTVFDVNFPVLKKVNESLSMVENRDVNGYPRYYARPAQINGSRYLITSEWYERNHDQYLKWLRKYVQH